MLEMMITFGVLGLLLFCGGPLLARWMLKDSPDPVGLGRLLQLLGVLMIVIAVVSRPHNPATAAFPPPERAESTTADRALTTTRSKPGGSVRDAALRKLEHPAVSSG